MVPEAELQQTDAGLVPASAGWFVMNARDARWFDKPGQGYSLPLTGDDEYEAETCASSRQFQKDGPWGFYCADEVARRYNASAPEDTQDGELAYGRFPPEQLTRYRDGLLPD